VAQALRSTLCCHELYGGLAATERRGLSSARPSMAAAISLETRCLPPRSLRDRRRRPDTPCARYRRSQRRNVGTGTPLVRARAGTETPFSITGRSSRNRDMAVSSTPPVTSVTGSEASAGMVMRGDREFGAVLAE
jgi:hypothetical protein